MTTVREQLIFSITDVRLSHLLTKTKVRENHRSRRSPIITDSEFVNSV